MSVNKRNPITGDLIRLDGYTPDATPTQNSNNAVSSGGTYTALEGKADKVTNATPGHLAGLDSNGNLTDSGVSPTEDVTVEGNPVTFDSPFEQDAKSVVVSVKPIQDLHGYDHPWVGGTGSNKCEVNTYSSSGYALGSPGHPVRFTITGKYLNRRCVFSGNGAYTFTVDGVKNGTSTPLDASGYNTSIENYMDVSAYDYVDISIYSNDNSNVLSDIFIGFSNTEVLMPYEPYSNICPISGIDEVEIPVTGKNKWSLSNSYTSTSHGDWVQTNTPFVLPAGQYILSYTDASSDQNAEFYIMDASDNVLVDSVITSNGARCSNTIILSADSAKLAICMYGDSRTISDIQLELGSTATPYEPYNPNSHTTTIPLPSTLYNADVDVTNGDADSRSGIGDIGLFDTTWTYDSTNNRFITGILADVIKHPLNDSTLANILCEGLKPMSLTALKASSDDALIAIGDTGGVSIRLNAANGDQAVLKTLLTGIKLCYELATPTTLSFTPTDVELLEGTNVVSTNGEKVAVTYKAGILATLGDIDDLNDKVKTKFDKKDVAKVEGTNASKPYSVGDYMLRSDGFYVVTQAIAQNAPITSNNTEKTTVGNELSNKADSDIDGDMRPITSNAVHDIKQSLLNKIPDYPIEWFDFTQDIVYNENITFGTEYTFTIPTTSSSHYYLQNSKLLWMAYKLPSEQQDNRGRSNYAVVNVWGGTDSRNFVMATFFDIDDDGNMFYVKIYDYHDETNQFKLKADYVNGYIPSSPMSLLINYIRQSPERWR